MTADSSTGKSQRSKKGTETTPEAVRAAFVSCGRCSFFLTAYTLLHDDYGDAASNSGDGWLHLTGGDAVRKLVHKSYGARIDLDSHYEEGLCSECRRRYIFDAGEEEGEAGGLQVQVTPG